MVSPIKTRLRGALPRPGKAGARLAFTYQGERLKGKVEALVADFGEDTLVTECDVSCDDDIDRVFGEVGAQFDG